MHIIHARLPNDPYFLKTELIPICPGTKMEEQKCHTILFQKESDMYLIKST